MLSKKRRDTLKKWQKIINKIDTHYWTNKLVSKAEAARDLGYNPATIREFRYRCRKLLKTIN